uniref:Leonurin n=1 Tax=Leonurus japonicus TaxID=4138 RepID=Q5FZI3_LEOJA|nr:leonurin [Leonurus japonicus]
MLQGRQFRSCQSYLRQRGNVLEMATGNPQSQTVEECCESLKDIERKQQQCGCEAIKHAMRQMQGGQSEEVYRKARMLPRTCGLRSQQCQFNVIFV